MKMNKFFMLGLAGLAFAACSNEEEVVDNSQIKGAVSINIKVPVLTRAIDATTGADGSTVTVVPQGNVVITLSADKGGDDISLTPEQWTQGKVVTFWGVENPRSVTVTMNGGVPDYGEVGIETLQDMPVSIPVYGSTDRFTTDGSSATPGDYTTGNGSGTLVPEDHQIGGEDNTTYQMWQATVNLEIPVARLEVSGIKHVTHPYNTPAGEEQDETTCLYETLTIDGVYLDNLKLTGNGTRQDLYFIEGAGAGSAVSPLKEEIPTDYTPEGGTVISKFNDFLRTGGVWPADDVNPNTKKAYAWNFYGPTAAEIAGATTQEQKQALNPKFKIYFENAEAIESEDPISAPRYAMITNYKNSEGESIVLENGHIYRITEVVLKDANIIGDESGNTLIGVEVTVHEAAWTINDIQADWAQ